MEEMPHLRFTSMTPEEPRWVFMALMGGSISMDAREPREAFLMAWKLNAKLFRIIIPVQQV